MLTPWSFTVTVGSMRRILIPSMAGVCPAASLGSSGSTSMPMTSPVLSVTASGASTVLVRRIIIPRWSNPILGSLPVLFMLGTLLITSARYASVIRGFRG